MTEVPCPKDWQWKHKRARDTLALVYSAVCQTEGQSSTEIAENLHVCTRTVRRHLALLRDLDLIHTRRDKNYKGATEE